MSDPPCCAPPDTRRPCEDDAHSRMVLRQFSGWLVAAGLGLTLFLTWGTCHTQDFEIRPRSSTITP